MSDEPILTLNDAEELPTGQIGELIVSGPQVSTRYVTGTQWNARAKISAEPGVWHRMGDIGYLDEQQRFWYCGRLSHRVQTSDGELYPVCCEAIFNQHPAVRRSALVGIGKPGSQQPLLFVEPSEPTSTFQAERLIAELTELGSRFPLTGCIKKFEIRSELPTDVRHNSKIDRPQLAREVNSSP